MSVNSKQQIIMGVDPGTNILGYSIICSDKNTIKILINGVIQLKKTDDHFVRLGIIYTRLCALIKEYQPTAMAIEAPFFGKNVQSMLKLGRAQGAAIVAGASNNIEVIEYSPRRIKQSITGRGNASKEQVAKMLQSTLQLTSLPKYFDETDALAVAVCHINASKKIAVTGKQFKNWSDFIQANPGKVK
ncbi:MAG TPA: crossover junction endodeoxyribonuclease RuvC [Chitinophagales bacterium]|nr:crossover junction endodeoxyribonuclease RuvC [Chitinophagales bacterium]HRG27172.1 crossover junction endodeoxyribonuclease RuvC [Chitinophagales bacterium]HRG84107.1 crossover junction endodeoxyribonuclease RuvC [Chitinophagales bacterium]HRH51963.1 crossover junction endodeoxyribonuclease RuvC [Chitinophagales bacterium]